MSYLISQILVCLLVAFVLGAIIGWLLKRIGGAGRERALRADIARLQDELADARAGIEDPLPAAALAETSATAAAARASAVGSGGASTVADPAVVRAQSHPIEAVDGIGPGYAQRLTGIGVTTTQELLDRCGDAGQMMSVAEQTGVEQFVIEKWVCMADLLRVSGIDGPQAELLVFAGVDSAADLADRQAAALAALLKETNEREQRMQAPAPDAATLEGWITTAGRLPPRA